MRFNTVNKRQEKREFIIYALNQKGIHNRAATTITDRWIRTGLRGIESKIVRDALSIAMIEYIFFEKGSMIF